MAITIQFLLNWLSNVIPNFDQLASNFRKAKKQNKPTELIELIYDACLNEAQKTIALKSNHIFTPLKSITRIDVLI